ncbi:mechanosensitive ion channel family protein [Lysobacter niastensis]|uniref:Mechanosensitive ion channel n=1 Tax=Lysobacter niastensis TaxID=380629 RepID=A0ABS0B921_9GAMM|nr:mechanosensitive ion channel domain-containing protein [Lysobacter niastensis]MBF6025513.1 mechanosensitive ion channel [Lysobacter niastensis]
MLVRFGWLAWIFCAALALASHSASAQVAASPGDAEAKGPAAIPVADIPSRADSDERFAEEVVLRASSADPTASLSPRLEAIARSVETKAKLFRGDELRTLPVMRLESLERHWKFDARQFSRWQKDMRDATAPYAVDADDLAHRRADWEATQAIAARGDMPAALSARVDSLVTQLKAAEQALSTPLAQQIALGRRANSIDSRIQAGLKVVALAIDYIDSRLVRIDAPPLWADTSRSAVGQGALESLVSGMKIELGFLREYSAANLGNTRVLNLFQLLLLPLLLWLGYRSRRAEASVADPRFAAADKVLRRPVSTWLLLSMMGVLVFEPDAPLLLHQIAMLVALVPVLRLMPPESSRLLGPWPYVAAGLYLLERLGFLFLANGFFYRSYHLGLTLLAMLLTLWLLWRSRKASYSGLAGRIGKVIHVAAWGSMGLLAISAASNILGNVSLAEMLTSGIIDSGYFGLVLHSAVTVFLAILHWVLVQRGVHRFRIGPSDGLPLLQLFARLLTAAAVIMWLAFAMNRFRIFRPAYALAEGALKHTFRFGEISISLGHVLVFAVSVLIAFWAAKTVRYLLQEHLLTKMALPRGVGNSVASLTYYALLLLGLVVALSAAGFKVSQLAFVFGALGVGIGFGLQNVVNNFVSGLILMFERPIQPGDVVDITGTTGRVRDIGMRATTIKTFEGADVIVPNGTLLSEKVVNWTLLDRNRRLDVDVGVAYGSEPAQVAALLKAAADATHGVAKEPAPVVLFTGLGASALNFTVRAWTYDFDNSVDIRSDLVSRVYASLVGAGIEIPYPQQDVHLRSVSPEAQSALAPSPTQEEGAEGESQGHEEGR